MVKLRELRARHELTQRALAARLGVKHNTVSDWERGYSCPQLRTLREIADFYGVSMDDIEIPALKRAAGGGGS